MVEHVGLSQRSYSTPGPVSTGMGDRLRASKPPRFVTSHSRQLSLLPSAGRKNKYQPKWRQYINYSEADFEVFRPAGATHCTDGVKFGTGEGPLLHAKFHRNDKGVGP